MKYFCEFGKILEDYKILYKKNLIKPYLQKHNKYTLIV